MSVGASGTSKERCWVLPGDLCLSWCCAEIPKFPSERHNAGKNWIFLQSSIDGCKRPWILTWVLWLGPVWIKCLMCQKADFCSRSDVHVTLAGGKGTVQMKELQPMASRSSVSTGDPAREKAASGHWELKRIKQEVRFYQYFACISKKEDTGETVSMQHRMAWSSHVHQLLWPVAEGSQKLNGFQTVCESLLDLTLFPVAIISFHDFPWLQSQHHSSEEVFM